MIGQDNDRVDRAERKSMNQTTGLRPLRSNDLLSGNRGTTTIENPQCKRCRTIYVGIVTMSTVKIDGFEYGPFCEPCMKKGVTVKTIATIHHIPAR